MEGDPVILTIKNKILILLVFISVLTSPLLIGNKTFAVTLTPEKENFDEFLLSEDIPIVPLDPSTVINLDENPNYVEEEISPLSSCNYRNYSRTSESGSEILLVGNTSSYGYCHIKNRHMRINGLPNFSTPDGASQFVGAYTALGMMELAMQVIDGTTVLHDTNNPNRKYKQVYISSFERNDVRIVIHKGSDWGSGYSNYDWIIVTAYPVFKNYT